MKYVNYILILVGAILGIYSNFEGVESQYGIIIGITLLMIGVYRISKAIPSKEEDTNEEAGK